MTPRQRVLKKHPKAYCFFDHFCGLYRVVRGEAAGNVWAPASTAQKAWLNAMKEELK